MRRVLTAAAIAVVALLCACGGGGDESSASTASTTLPGTTTEAPATTSPRVSRFCTAAEELFAAVATLPVDDLETLRALADDAVQLTGEMEANATKRMEPTVLVLKAAATRVKDTVDDAEDLETANAAMAELSTPAVAEATQRVTGFLEGPCED